MDREAVGDKARLDREKTAPEIRVDEDVVSTMADGGFEPPEVRSLSNKNLKAETPVQASDIMNEVQSSSSPLTASVLRKTTVYVSKGAQKFVAKSNFMDCNKEGKLPRYREEEIQVGGLIRRGTFSDWFEINAIVLDDVDRQLTWSDDEHQKTLRRATLAEDVNKRSLYALKRISKQALTMSKTYAEAASRFTAELFFLVNLRHPHLIKIHGFSQPGLRGFRSGTLMGFFCVVDRINLTLEDKIDIWCAEDLACQMTGASLSSATDKTTYNIAGRINVACDVASALAYLHEKNVIHRSLRLNTIGFDAHSKEVKIIDLGMAKELDHTNLRRDTASPKLDPENRVYTAPEVACQEMYHQSADVYNFAFILWHMLSLNTTIPFIDLKEDAYFDLCVLGDSRPKVEDHWPVSELLMLMWARNPVIRPSVKEVLAALEKEVVRWPSTQRHVGNSPNQRPSTLRIARSSFRRRRSVNRPNLGAQQSAQQSAAATKIETSVQEEAPGAYLKGHGRIKRRTSI